MAKRTPKNLILWWVVHENCQHLDFLWRLYCFPIPSMERICGKSFCCFKAYFCGNTIKNLGELASRENVSYRSPAGNPERVRAPVANQSAGFGSSRPLKVWSSYRRLNSCSIYSKDNKRGCRPRGWQDLKWSSIFNGHVSFSLQIF